MIKEVPVFKITYNGKDITADLSDTYLSCQYEDKVEGESDELSITLDDTSGKWTGSWYPEKGAKLTLDIEYKGEKLKCGTFEIDQIDVSGPPAQVVIKAIAAGIGNALRSKGSKAYDKQTLRGIANLIAKKHGFTVQGEIENIQIERVTQHREGDLEFLKRLSSEYGYVFNVRDKKLVFTSLYKLEESKKVTELDRTELLDWSFSDKAVAVYKESSVKHFNPKKGEVVQSKTDVENIKNKDGIGFNYITSKDSANSYVRAENPAQAQAKSKALLYRMNTKQNEGSVRIDGNCKVVAGVNIMLTGLGVISGKYHILRSRHTIDRSRGYGTELEVKRVAGVEDKKQQTAKKAKKAAAAPATKTNVNRITNRDGIGFNTIGQ